MTTKIYRKMKRILTKIKRVFCYIPLVYKLESWDFEYVYPLLIKFIEELRESKRLDQDASKDKRVKEMTVTIEILKRYLYDGFSYTHPVLSKWIDRGIWNNFKFTDEDDEGLHRLVDPRGENEHRLHTKLFKESSAEEEYRYKYLLQMLGKSRNWWS